jgi:predicted permease
MSWARFFRRRRWDEERARELQSYLELETDENVARGLSPEAAREAARRKLGEPLRIREEIYLMNTVGIFDAFGQDLRYGLRILRLNPGFAVVAILSLALGVGANSAIFQLLDAVRLRLLPVKDPQALAEIRITQEKGRTGSFHGRFPMLTNPLWERLRTEAQGFESLAAWGTQRFDLADGGEARFANAIWVSGGFFDVLGVRPEAGRLLVAEDDRRGCASPGVVVSHAFASREMGGGAAAVGRTIRLDGHVFPVLGVTPAGFFGFEVGRQFDVAVPLCAEPIFTGARSVLDDRHDWFLSVIGRLKPGWSVERTSAQLATLSPGIFEATIAPQWSPTNVAAYRAFTLQALSAGTGLSRLRRDYEAPLWALLATTGLVLLIACANLANIMLARASAREREIAVRLAIGASRGRIVRQLLAESFLLAVAGALAGFVLARWLGASIVAFLSNEANPIFVDLQPDARVLGFTALLALLTCVIFGLAPALRATHVAPGAAMKSGGRGITAGRERFGLRRLLVVTQMALSLVLVVGALLFVGTLRNLLLADAGFDPDGILVADVDFQRAGVSKEEVPEMKAAMLRAVAAASGATAVAATAIVPMSGSGWNNRILIDGNVQADYCNFNEVSPDYFKVMRTPLVSGRDFDARDLVSSTPVAIVSRSFVLKYLAGRDPLRASLQIETPPGVPRLQYQIVGVVEDTKVREMREPFAPLAYLAAAQNSDPDQGIGLLVRGAGGTAPLRPEVVRAIASVNPQASVSFDTITSQVQRRLLPERLMATVSGFFGALAGIIAAIGLYGVMSYLVARRRNEIGIRMALGADRAAVVKMVLRESGLLLGAGIVVGAGLAAGAARTASALFFGVSPGDPLTFVKAAATLALVAAVASYLPAERAARVDPLLALREE